MTENNINELSFEDLELVSGGKGKMVVATKDGANIRSGPGTKFAAIAQTKKGAVATFANETAFSDGKTWIRVTWGSKSGWISTEFVKEV